MKYKRKKTLKKSLKRRQSYKKKKSTRKKALKKKGGMIPRPQLKRYTVEERREQLNRARIEGDRRAEELRRQRALLTTNRNTPFYNTARVALFDGYYGRPEAPGRFDEIQPGPWLPAHSPFSYVDVAIRQLSNMRMVRGLQKERISSQRTALQGILEDILTQFENFITEGVVTPPPGEANTYTSRQATTYNDIQNTIRRSNISQVISNLRDTGRGDDAEAANVLREYIYGLLPRLDPSGPTPLQPSSTPSSLSSKKGGKRLKKK
jgi:hypothetical protein